MSANRASRMVALALQAKINESNIKPKIIALGKGK